MTAEVVTEHTRHAFDAAAPYYDLAYENLEGIKRLRSITVQMFLHYFQPGRMLLELNCGTGTDAVFLAHQGIKVLATDLSPIMINEAQRKIESEGLREFIETQLLPFDALETLRGRLFDGAYSNLGGLNCTNDLDSIAASLSTLIRPRGYFIATVMPDFCLWETVAFVARFQWKRALRRRHPEGSLASLHGGTVRTYYHSPRKLFASFSLQFDLVETVGLNIFTPPPNSTQAYAALGRVMNLLEKLETMTAHLPMFSAMGDHFIMVLRRKTS